MDDLRKQIEQQVRAEFSEFADAYRAQLIKNSPPAPAPAPMADTITVTISGTGETLSLSEFHRRCMDSLRAWSAKTDEADIAKEVERRMQIIGESGT